MKTTSYLLLITGLVLIIYLIFIEDEPGAVPIVMILAGTLLFLFSKFQKAVSDT